METSTHPKRTQTKIYREWVKLPAHPKRTEMNSRRVAKGKRERERESSEAIIESAAWAEQHLKHPKTL